MEVEFVNPFILKPNPWNTNKMDRENFEKLKQSLTALACFKPIIVRSLGDNFEILGGAHRVEAAKELGLETIPIINLGDISDERAKEISLVDNTRYGKDDIELLNKLLDEIDTTLLESIMPDEIVELPEIEPFDLEGEGKGEEREEDEYKTLHFKYPIDKAEEVEAVLARLAYDKGFKYRDGYTNYPEALYYIVTKFEK